MINHIKAPFIEKIERVQYNTCLVITGAFKGTSRDGLYQELGLESSTKSDPQQRIFQNRLPQQQLTLITHFSLAVLKNGII